MIYIIYNDIYIYIYIYNEWISQEQKMALKMH